MSCAMKKDSVINATFMARGECPRENCGRRAVNPIAAASRASV